MCKALDEIQKCAEDKGIRKGRIEGISQGISQGMLLIQKLLADGRQEDVALAATEALYRQKLFAEYGMEGARI